MNTDLHPQQHHLIIVYKMVALNNGGGSNLSDGVVAAARNRAGLDDDYASPNLLKSFFAGNTCAHCVPLHRICCWVSSATVVKGGGGMRGRRRRWNATRSGA